MANARTTLKERRATDAKGVDLIFNSPEVSDEEAAPGKTEAASRKPTLAKVTIYVRPDQVLAVEKIQVAERERTGKRRDKSELIQEALDLLVEKYNLK